MGDVDGDGYCDGLIAVDTCLAGDAFPTQSSEWIDSDNDGWGDNNDYSPNDPNKHSLGRNLTSVGSYYDADSYTFAVAISGNYAYVADGDNGLVIINITDPANPTLAGSYATGTAYEMPLIRKDFGEPAHRPL